MEGNRFVAFVLLNEILSSKQTSNKGLKNTKASQASPVVLDLLKLFIFL